MAEHDEENEPRPLEWVTQEELLEELSSRHRCIVVVCCSDAKVGTSTESFLFKWAGSMITCYALSQLAVDKFRSKIAPHIADIDAEDEEEE